MSVIVEKANQPFIICTVGLPGSGKSKWIAEELIPYLSTVNIYAEVLSSDDIIQHIASVTQKPFDRVSFDCIREAESVVEDRIALSSYMMLNIVLDQRNIRVSTRRNRLKLLNNSKEYTKIAVVFDSYLEILKARNKNRGDRKIAESMLDLHSTDFQKPALSDGFDEIMTPLEFKLKYMTEVKKEETIEDVEKSNFLKKMIETV